jgi:ElaB/YqjD/DUF883 family membrane-anchored ribosome-binding protein
MTYTKQLEREADLCRAQLSDTLAEFRAAATPGRVVDQLAEYAGDGDAGEFFRGLRHQVARNPLPVTLIGAGVAWLAFASAGGGRSNGRAVARAGRLRQAASEGVADARQTVHDTAVRAREAGDDALHAAQDAIDEAAHTAGAEAQSLYERTKERAHRVSDRATGAMKSAAGQTKALGQHASSGGRSLVDFCREQPLVLAGVGLALGAALGALLPSTEAEDRLMVDASDEIKKRTSDVAEAALKPDDAKPHDAKTDGVKPDGAGGEPLPPQAVP